MRCKICTRRACQGQLSLALSLAFDVPQSNISWPSSGIKGIRVKRNGCADKRWQRTFVDFRTPLTAMYVTDECLSQGINNRPMAFTTEFYSGCLCYLPQHRLISSISYASSQACHVLELELATFSALELVSKPDVSEHRLPRSDWFKYVRVNEGSQHPLCRSHLMGLLRVRSLRLHTSKLHVRRGAKSSVQERGTLQSAIMSHPTH